LNQLKKKHFKKKKDLQELIESLRAECEELKIENDELREHYNNSRIFSGKLGEAKNSRVSFEMFWLCTQLVTVYNVPEYLVVDVVSFVLKEVGMIPKNFPSATWAKEIFSIGTYRTFLLLVIISFLNEYCEEDYLTEAADISSLKGQSVNCIALYAKLKSTGELIKVPVFIYEVLGKESERNYENFMTRLCHFEKLNQQKYVDSPPIIARVTSSLGDKDNAEGKFQALVEETALKLRKDTELEEISNWVHGSCFQHNLDGNLIIFLHVSVNNFSVSQRNIIYFHQKNCFKIKMISTHCLCPYNKNL